MMCFLIGPGRTDMCSFYIYTSQYLREFFSTLRYCLFSLGKYLGQQITHLTFIATYSLTYTKCALRVQVLCCAFIEKRAIDLFTNYNTLQIKNDATTLENFKPFFFKKANSGVKNTFFHSTATGLELWGEGAGGEAHLMASNEYDHQ